MKIVTYIKCTDCGLLRQQIGSLQEMGVLDGNNCSNCGGEIVLLNRNFTDRND